MNRDILVIGGGRWARAIVGTLCEFVPPTVGIRVCSIYNAKAVLDWAKSLGADKRIIVSAEWPQIEREGQPAVIVVNAAKDHFAAAQRALRAGAAVLIEKPVALSSRDVSDLIALAAINNARLAASQVFLYSRYFDLFKNLISSSGNLNQIEFTWTDPPYESRYGEQKYYDTSLPVYADWLPHILSMLGSLMPNMEPELRGVIIYRGGAQMSIDLAYGDTNCLLNIARNGDRRERLLVVETQNNKACSLDFSREPGTIDKDGDKTVGDIEWNSKPRPLRSMLESFINWANGGAYNSCLDINLGLQACKIIDQVETRYREKQFAWITERLNSSDEMGDVDLNYALAELQMVRSDFV